MFDNNFGKCGWIFLRITWWKNFENWSTFAKVIIKHQGPGFFGTRCILDRSYSKRCTLRSSADTAVPPSAVRTWMRGSLLFINSNTSHIAGQNDNRRYANVRYFLPGTVKQTSDPQRRPSPRPNWNCDWNTTRYLISTHVTRCYLFPDTPNAIKYSASVAQISASVALRPIKHRKCVTALSCEIQKINNSNSLDVFNSITYICV